MRIAFKEFRVLEVDSLDELATLHTRDIEIITIDDKDYAGVCEVCRKPLTYDDNGNLDAHTYADDVLICNDCEKEDTTT